MIAFFAKTLLIPEFQVFHQILQITIFFVQKQKKCSYLKIYSFYIEHTSFAKEKIQNPESLAPKDCLGQRLNFDCMLLEEYFVLNRPSTFVTPNLRKLFRCNMLFLTNN